MNPQRKYLEAKVRTASPQELMLMLFDGAIRFAGLAKPKLEEKQYSESCEHLLRAQNIMLELIGALSPDTLGPDVHDRLAGHYWFIYDRLVRANLRHTPKSIDEALHLLGRIRDNWAQAIRGGAAPPASPSDPEGRPVEAAAVSSVNLEG